MNPTAWRLLPYECATGRANRALDQALRHSVAAGGPPVLRFYGWRPAALSLGYAQSADDVRADVCRARGIDLVRRPTGGRAILHDDEL
ncbi:MAG TPA: lipoate--protein ligase family protein, partial [Limnochordia bacterium]|nr:lipoate--protein ligase family protein [Limnochordia bacterium]